MKHITFTDNNKYNTAVLIKTNSLIKTELLKNYIVPLKQLEIDPDNLIAVDLKYNEHGKCPVKFIKEYLDKLLKALKSLNITTLYVCDSSYFKVLTKSKKADMYLGYVLPCAIEGYENMNVVLGVNHHSLFYNPANQEKLDLSLKTLAYHLRGIYKDIGSNIIHSGTYPHTLESIRKHLNIAFTKDALAVDIETYSLSFKQAGLASISFAWNAHNGIAFAIDHKTSPDYQRAVRGYLRTFFEKYEGTLMGHGLTFDFKVLIYELWMKDENDIEGMIAGLEVLTKKFNDTYLIAYLATNSCAGNKLSLKELAHEYAGNYALEGIADVHSVSVDSLLRYNLVDSLCTWYVFNKYFAVMVRDKQLQVYKNILKPVVKVVIQMELSGMPLNKQQVDVTKGELERIHRNYEDKLFKQPTIANFSKYVKLQALLTTNAKLKKKVKTIDEFDDVRFNPNSNVQLSKLIFEYMGYEPIYYTEKNQPSTSAKVLDILIHKAVNQEHKNIFECLIGLIKVSKIITTFIPAMTDRDIMYGNFNICGTVSGRMSSSKVNLQQIPSTGTRYASVVKKCFKAPEGYLMIGVDFDALEDKIIALKTRDPNRIKIYTEGFDGHCLRSYSYFKKQMPDITIEVESINSIKVKYPDLRQKSKGPTFLLAYAGTHHGLMNNLGFTRDEAMQIERNYKELYKVTNEWTNLQLTQAAIDGYVTLAFGLRLRTPILKQVLTNNKKTPYEAHKEGKTAGNALCQSYGLLNSRAAIEFQDRVLKSKYRLMIKPIAHIHDSQYFIVKRDADLLYWINKNLIECVSWQDLPELKHNQVKLGGTLEIYYPTWDNGIKVKNNATKDEILDILRNLK